MEQLITEAQNFVDISHTTINPPKFLVPYTNEFTEPSATIKYPLLSQTNENTKELARIQETDIMEDEDDKRLKCKDSYKTGIYFNNMENYENKKENAIELAKKILDKKKPNSTLSSRPKTTTNKGMEVHKMEYKISRGRNKVNILNINERNKSQNKVEVLKKNEDIKTRNISASKCKTFENMHYETSKRIGKIKEETQNEIQKKKEQVNKTKRKIKENHLLKNKISRELDVLLNLYNCQQMPITFSIFCILK